MNFYFCESCGKRVTEVDLAKGAARDKKLAGVYCSRCAAGAVTMENLPLSKEDALAALPPPAESPLAQKPRKTSEVALRRVSAITTAPPREGLSRESHPDAVWAHTPASPSSTPLWIWGAAGLGVMLLVAGIAALGGSSSRNAPAPGKGVQEAPAVAVPAFAPPPISRPGASAGQPVAGQGTAGSEFPEALQARGARGSSLEAEAQDAYDRLVRFEGLAPGDRVGRLARIEPFLERYGSCVVAARARVLRSQLERSDGAPPPAADGADRAGRSSGAAAPSFEPRAAGPRQPIPAKPSEPVETVWIEDDFPEPKRVDTEGVSCGRWVWVAAEPRPRSGTRALQSLGEKELEQCSVGFGSGGVVGAGEVLFAHVFLDPARLPGEVMLQWRVGRDWEHRAYWGANKVDWGTEGTAGRRSLGALPPAGQWVRLEVPASLVDLQGKPIDAVAMVVFGGRATWDRVGKAVGNAQAAPPAPAAPGAAVPVVPSPNPVGSSATQPPAGGAPPLPAQPLLPFSIALPASADAWAGPNYPDTNMGLTLAHPYTEHYDDAGGIYLRFSLAWIKPGLIVRKAVLQLRGLEGNRIPLALFSEEDGAAWSETGLSYRNRPPLKDELAVLRPAADAKQVEWDATAFLKRELAAGRQKIELVVRHRDGGGPSSFSSREGPAPPLLLLEGEAPFPVLVARGAGWCPLKGGLDLEGFCGAGAELAGLRWSKEQGPGVVSFPSSTQLKTRATFSAPGGYRIRLQGALGSRKAEAFLDVQVYGLEVPLVPQADGFVAMGQRGERNGRAKTLNAHRDPERDAGIALLRFDLRMLPKNLVPVKALLFFYAQKGVPSGMDLSLIENGANGKWLEETLNWDERPALETFRRRIPLGAGATWVEVDVSDWVLKRLSQQSPHVGFGLLATTFAQPIGISSREGSNPPYLVLYGDRK